MPRGLDNQAGKRVAVGILDRCRLAQTPPIPDFLASFDIEGYMITLKQAREADDFSMSACRVGKTRHGCIYFRGTRSNNRLVSHVYLTVLNQKDLRIAMPRAE